jgi:hypothetical protein
LHCEQGFAIQLASFISLAFSGANVSRVGTVVVDIIQPNEFVGLIVGAIFLTNFNDDNEKCRKNCPSFG